MKMMKISNSKKYCCYNIDEILKKHGEHISDMLKIWKEEYDFFYVTQGKQDKDIKFNNGCGFLFYDISSFIETPYIMFNIKTMPPHWDEL